MPTFDFQCAGCDHVFEFNRPFGNKETPPCPTCGGTDVQKLISPPTIHFKGEGFYKTDSQKEQKKPVKKEGEKKEETKETKEKPPKEQKDSKKDEK
jgi:putative FmdB family regulatory protein